MIPEEVIKEAAVEALGGGSCPDCGIGDGGKMEKALAEGLRAAHLLVHAVTDYGQPLCWRCLDVIHGPPEIPEQMSTDQAREVAASLVAWADGVDKMNGRM